MNAQEQLVRDLALLNEDDLLRVGSYVAFLKSKSHRLGSHNPDEDSLRVMYAEAAEEDSALAERGMNSYSASLKKEDTQ